MKQVISPLALFLALLLSACTGSSTVSQNTDVQSSSSAGVQIEVVHDEIDDRNVLVGESSSSSELGIAGYQVQANQMFQSRYAGQSPTSSNNGGASFNGNVQGTISYDANGNVINTSGNSGLNGNASGNAQTSVSSSSTTRSGNPSA